MTTLTEGQHEGEFIGEMAMGIGYHVDAGTLATGNNLKAGAIVASVGGKYVEYDGAASDGSQTVTGILMGNVNAAVGDKACTVFKRGPAVVNKNDLQFAGDQTDPHKTAAYTALLGLGIKAA
ncbi:head decoration protein [Caenibius sp. WL]|uniref:head decoration protein n=1 Tax=Caenibius sp. WL TaxID=2872646 RepID=UPI001C9A149D|nr:head decoration protein [Caenibius sp. WL]QZP06803.1 head decoration protein [Caenibius sp. WL]